MSDIDPCAVCSKRVYEMEKVPANAKLFHKFCFRCTTCKNLLGMGNFAFHKGELYCKNHYRQVSGGYIRLNIF